MKFVRVETNRHKTESEAIGALKSLMYGPNPILQKGPESRSNL